MKMQTHTRGLQIAATSDFETFLTIRKLTNPEGKIELKFETVFAHAKDPKAKQTKAQFFIDQDQAQEFIDALQEFSAT